MRRPCHRARSGRRFLVVGIVLAALLAVSPATPTPSGQAVASADEQHVVPFPPDTMAAPEALSDADADAGQAGQPDLGGAAAQPRSIDVEHLTRFSHESSVEALHVKLVDGGSLELDKGQLVGLDARTNGALGEALKAADATFEPLFKRSTAELDAERRGREVATGTEQVDLNSWVRVTIGEPDAAPELLELLNLMPGVEAALPEPQLAPASLASFAQPPLSTPDYVPNQLYLQPAPVGIDAAFAATVAGGNGANTSVADVEYSWTTTHEDLPDALGAEIFNGTPVDPVANPNHGTAVLGIIGAEDNGYGITGVVPAAELALVNVSNTAGDRLAEAIDLASANLEAGDVLLIEQQLCPPGGLVGTTCVPGWLPVEWWPAYHDAIGAAVGQGLIVVEPAGNGARSVDTELTMPDSGAIMVGAGNPAIECTVLGVTPARARLPFSNHGSRVDLQSHGACVWSTGAEGGAVDRSAAIDAQYSAFFSGTSASAAIVAGAAASLSSVAIGVGRPLSPAAIQSLLRSTGTPQDVTIDPSPIGPQPDLQAAIGVLQNTSVGGPVNDDFANPTVIGAVPFAASQATAGASVQAAEPVSTCGSTSGTVWYSVAVDSDVLVDLAVSGESSSPSVALWRVLSDDGLEQVECAGRVDGPGTTEISAALLAGHEYRIQVGGGAGAPISLQLAPAETPAPSVGCDLDGDGFGDIVIGVPGESVNGRAGAGAVNVFYGQPDGGPDRAPLLHQGSKGVRGSPSRGDEFGAAVACGDIDGDGYDDAAVGAPGETRSKRVATGVVHVFFGGPGGLSGARDMVVSQATKGVPGKSEKRDRFGAALAIGDVNGDGYGDLVIGAPGETLRGRRRAGAVTVTPGGRGGLSTAGSTLIHQNKAGIASRAQAGDRFGAALAVGDTNNDGFDDLYIAAPTESLAGVENVGMVTELLGGPDGPDRTQARWLAPTRKRVSSAARPGSQFGAALDLADINGDGFVDLVVGAPGAGRGRVDVVVGSAQRLGSVPSVVVAPSGASGSGDRFGASLKVDDLDADGAPELYVGAPGAARKAGAVHIIRLDRDLLPESSNVLSQDTAGVPGTAEAGDRFGAALGVGDFDADGYGDLVVGAPGERLSRRANAGLALIVPGAAGGAAIDRARSVHQRRPGIGGAIGRRDRFASALGS